MGSGFKAQSNADNSSSLLIERPFRHNLLVVCGGIRAYNPSRISIKMYCLISDSHPVR